MESMVQSRIAVVIGGGELEPDAAGHRQCAAAEKDAQKRRHDITDLPLPKGLERGFDIDESACVPLRDTWRMLLSAK